MHASSSRPYSKLNRSLACRTSIRVHERVDRVNVLCTAPLLRSHENPLRIRHIGCIISNNATSSQGYWSLNVQMLLHSHLPCSLGCRKDSRLSCEVADACGHKLVDTSVPVETATALREHILIPSPASRRRQEMSTRRGWCPENWIPKMVTQEYLRSSSAGGTCSRCRMCGDVVKQNACEASLIYESDVSLQQ
jgi:hypothetical protein